jgi:hypothetical protein
MAIRNYTLTELAQELQCEMSHRPASHHQRSFTVDSDVYASNSE